MSKTAILKNWKILLQLQISGENTWITYQALTCLFLHWTQIYLFYSKENMLACVLSFALTLCKTQLWTFDRTCLHLTTLVISYRQPYVVHLEV